MATGQQQRGRHRAPAPAPAAAARAAGQRAGQAGRRAGRAATVPVTAAGRVTGGGQQLGRRYTARHMLTAELLAAVGITAIRAVADYEVQGDGTVKGKVGHPAGQYGPLPVLAGLIVTFFLLAFLAASGGIKAKIAVIAGGLVILVLAMKSLDEFTAVSATFGSFGKAKAPAGDWITSGTQAGSPLAPQSSAGGGSTSSGGNSGGGDNTLPPPVSM